MKKLILLSFLLGCSLCFSQVNDENIPPTRGTPSDRPEDRKPAEYPGGITAFMQEAANKIQPKKIKGVTGNIRAKAKFSINTNGEIEKVFVTGDNQDFNKEVERVILSMSKKWKPEEYKGKPVLSWYTVPITLNFD
ncbi:energy transducer TonB [Chryseobacterium sp. PMSZPI]|uniref:energy transducer TonB n=1 Tax=Chryseobacterium sp. PMSZPI TaxID=1033900 RepID=UPI000C3467EB|nr:energy transducer TonB [Chryseobacterium sp. PMSZPI]PKF75227.1 hypothetical protein CW752_05345 [Chryseobacterium sp. PMSZPI]